MMSKTTVILVRHGETDWNASGRWQGHSDIPLNDNGIQQAKLLASRLTSWPIKALYSSDLKRAARTASIIGDALGLQPEIDVSWRERNGGEFEGLKAEELMGHRDFQTQRRDKNWAPPGGESNVDVAVRVQTAFDKIVENHPDETVAVVTHGGAIISLLSLVVGFPPGERARIWVSANTGFSIVEVGKRGPILVRLNDDTHLDSD
jgi:probable phosphoglycerate mutase